MTRLRLDWMARPLPVTGSRFSTCFVVTAIVALPWLLHMVSLTAMFREQLEDPFGNHSNSTSKIDPSHGHGIPPIDPFNTWHSPLIGLFGFIILFWKCFILCQTRREIRRRHNIREECCCLCCSGCEDCCCTICCPHLAIYQMSRHTGDFGRQRAVCCNATGLTDRPVRQLPPMLV